jgi:hypothetical protein
MEKVEFPYSIWPGLLLVVALIGSGMALKQVSLLQEDSGPRKAPQQNDAITTDGGAENLR